jgi:hypothetical protein
MRKAKSSSRAARGRFSSTRRCGASTWASRSVRRLLGVRLRSAERWHLRSQLLGRHIRPAGGVRQASPPGRSNLSPFSGLQFFGEVNIASQGEEMTVDLRDINGVSVFSRTLQPRRG